MITMKRSLSYYYKNLDKFVWRSVQPLLPSHKPAFMIIGAQKSATTSLFNYLNQLSGLKGSRNKEIYYFDREMNYGKDLKWYHKFFKGLSPGEKKYFEATPNYLYYPWVAERLHRYNPSLKLIIILREPISRAYSAWNMYKGFFETNEKFRLRKGLRPGEKNFINEHLFSGRKVFPSFEEAMAIEKKIMASGEEPFEPSILRRGLYFQQLQQIYAFFPKDQVAVIGYKEISNETERTVSELYHWITGKTMDKLNLVKERRNAREYQQPMSDTVRTELETFYRDSNAKLFELLGRPLKW
jgi:hypothetical protein